MAVLRRVAITMPDAAARRLEVQLDGSPLVVIDLDDAAVYVSDRRAGVRVSHTVRLDVPDGHAVVRSGAVADEIYLLVGDVVALFVVPDGEHATRAEVRVIEPTTGRLLFDRRVTYRRGRERASPRARFDRRSSV